MRREVTPGFMEVGDEQMPSGIRAFPVDFRLCSYVPTTPLAALGQSVSVAS